MNLADFRIIFKKSWGIQNNSEGLKKSIKFINAWVLYIILFKESNIQFFSQQWMTIKKKVKKKLMNRQSDYLFLNIYYNFIQFKMHPCYISFNLESSFPHFQLISIGNFFGYNYPDRDKEHREIIWERKITLRKRTHVIR